MDSRNRHPLDVDLLSAAKDELDAVARSTLDEHLKVCLLCRIRLRRLTEADLPSLSAWQDHGYEIVGAIPADLQAMLEGEAQNPIPAAGQLWLAGYDERLMILINKVNGPVLISHPATLDLEMVDGETVVIDEQASPLGIPFVVWTEIIGDVDATHLTRFLGKVELPVRVEAFQKDEEVEDPPIDELLAERMEYRQLLADRLAELSPLQEDDEGTAETGGGELVSLLRDGLRFKRGPWCRVSTEVGWDLNDLPDRLGGWIAATIQELTCRILVVACRDVDQTLNRSATWMTLRQLMGMTDSTALALVEAEDPYETYVLEPQDLNEAIEAPSGNVVGPLTRRGPLEVVDALFKYLEEAVLPIELEPPTDRFLPPVDLDELIASTSRVKIQAKKAARTPTRVKKQAQEELDDKDAELLASLVQESTRGNPLFPAILRMARQE